MKNNWKIPDYQKKEVVAIIKGHRERKQKFDRGDCDITLATIDDLRKINAVQESLNEATARIDDVDERRRVAKYLILNIENYQGYPYRYCNTKLTEYQFFDMEYKFIYLVNKKIRS